MSEQATGPDRVHYRKLDGGTPLYVIFERHVGKDGHATEEVWEMGTWEVCWVRNSHPAAQELAAARWLLASGLGRTGWGVRLEDVVRGMADHG